MKLKQFIILAGYLTFSYSGMAQTETSIKNIYNSNSTENFKTTCGSHEVLKKIDKLNPQFISKSNKFLQDIQPKHALKSTPSDSVFNIPVVFHILYNTAQENIPDAFIEDQIEVLNACFSHTNADASNLRSEFIPLVGDMNIRFHLATEDPAGNFTNGITRTSTNITNFGGIMPYSTNQTLEIINWVNDSLTLNMFRLTETAKGGKDAWNTDKYLNIWVGDLSILEPQVNNTEELFLLGLATPPITHPNFPSEALDLFANFNQGALIDYHIIGSNNTIPFNSNNANLQNLVKEGKTVVHEVGHYLGLRHIWGDGNCSEDDYVMDTPKAASQSNYDCNVIKNTCTDNILGQDLPDMVENYMDYSKNSCQNAFTNGQGNVMINTLLTYRPELYSLENSWPVGIKPIQPNHFQITQKINDDNITIVSNQEEFKNATIRITDILGKEIMAFVMESNKIEIQLPQTGLFFITINQSLKRETYKIIK